MVHTSDNGVEIAWDQVSGKVGQMLLQNHAQDVCHLLGARTLLEPIDSVAGQPISSTQVVTKGMPQVVVVPDWLQHAHGSL